MRLAFVVPDDLSALLYCKGLIKALKHDDSIRIFLISSPMPGYQQEIRSLKAQVISIKMHRFFHPWQDLRYFLALFRVFRREKIDAVICWTTKPNIYGTIAARLAGVQKIIYAVRGLGSAFLQPSDLQSRLLYGFVSGCYRLAGLCADKAWFTNQEDLEFFLSRGFAGAERTFLTKNAVNVEDYSPAVISPEQLTRLRSELGLSPGDRVISMVARMIWSKGIREFVEASLILRDHFPNLKFILVGPLDQGGPQTVPLDYLQEQEKSDNFLWVGFRKDVKAIYALSDVAVLPSYYKEGGYPRALLEPMALGKPVITTDLPQCRGPVEEGRNGLLIPPREPKALAQAIASLMTDDTKRLQFGRHSREKIEQEFDERRVVDRVLAELY
jgi:N,N'-diacetylbacillosaminyl-diphospho-undecaprenol alpha-1,3-N-acetylgalactosaminyltransferase